MSFHTCRSHQDIREHVQAVLDNMSMEEFLEMVNYDPELNPLLNEAIAVWDNELLQIQVQHQPLLHPQPPHQPQQQAPQPP